MVKKKNHTVFLDISIDGGPPRRMVFEHVLLGYAFLENVVELLTVKLWLGVSEGTGGESIYGGKFAVNLDPTPIFYSWFNSISSSNPSCCSTPKLPGTPDSLPCDQSKSCARQCVLIQRPTSTQVQVQILF
ncbi:hypothetical protein KSP40_PGU013315 [Platanthera guangdongensis]|uniref:Uncharacterized protein n=1 Tax=Platanthera guangdongensis TaxID=2320717 RepID=A0ABR2LE92_9ASPA